MKTTTKKKFKFETGKLYYFKPGLRVSLYYRKDDPSSNIGWIEINTKKETKPVFLLLEVKEKSDFTVLTILYKEQVCATNIYHNRYLNKVFGVVEENNE